MPLLTHEPDVNARARERRARRRRQVRVRRAVAGGILLALAAGITLGARAVGSDHQSDRLLAPGRTGPRAGHACCPEGDPRRPRDDGARVAAGQAAALPRDPRAERDRARRQGRERAHRLRPLRGPARTANRCGRSLLQGQAGRQGRARARRVPDRARRHLRGPGALGEAARARDPQQRRLALAQQRGPRLDEPVRPARLALQRRRRGRRGQGRLRRDPVRLRSLSRATATSR